MPKRPFSGGITFDPQVDQLKNAFQVAPELAYFEPDQVVLPFDQHIGAPNELLVNVGETVRAGQIIAKTSADVSGYVHASISGTVIEVKEVPAFNGATQEAVIIKRSLEPAAPQLLPEGLAPAEAVRKAGVVGLGGATFPTHIKLDPDPAIQVEYVILNGAECEPFLHSDDFLMQKEAPKILRGAQIARNELGAQKILVAIEDDKPQAIQAMTAAAKTIPDCRIVTLPTRYPQGGEKQLLDALLAKESPVGRRTVSTGAYTMNVATSKVIADAVDHRRALTHRYITVTGAVAKPQVICFPLGTTAADLIAFCGGLTENPARVIHGGPMMGRTFTDLDLPLTKGSNGLLVFPEKLDLQPAESPCIRCNRCVEVCPIRLLPQEIDLAYRAGLLARCDQLLAEECINCGCCTYVCPAKRQLAAKITAAAGEIKQIKKELAKNDD